MSSTPTDGEHAHHDANPSVIVTAQEDGTPPDTDYFGHIQVEHGTVQDADLPQLGEQEDELSLTNDGEELPTRAEHVTSPTRTTITEPTTSQDDSVSIPDDTASMQGSVLSSPRGDVPSLLRPSPGRSPSSMRRPFDLRFQSRLSSSYLGSPRASSPAFLATHSRQSSLASFGARAPSEADDSTAPWEVIRWTKMKRLSSQVFSDTAKRNFGSPSCLVVTDQIVIGTSRGIILVFDHQQNHKAIIGSGTKAVECGAVTALAISADHTTVAAGHNTGHIFTWDIARSAHPFLHIQPLDQSQAQARKGDGHMSGSAVVHVGFLGYRHTALVSADDRGMAFSHLATRGMGSVGRVVRSTRVLGRYPDLLNRLTKPVKKSSVLAFAPLPLGNVEQSTDAVGLVAMMTPYLLVIVSTTPVAQTQHKAARPKEVAAHSAMTAALAWFPAIKLKSDSAVTRTKLAYAWSNILTVLEVHEVLSEEGEKEKVPDLQFIPRNRYEFEEAIVAIQWLNRSVLAVLTITQRLLVIQDVSMNVTDSFDLLQKNIYHADLYSTQLQTLVEQLDEEDASMHGVVADAFHMSFRAYKGRLFLLGRSDVWWGSLTNWADRLLALMNIGDFIGALKLATSYYAGVGEKATIGLPEDDATRSVMVQEKLLEMMSASLKYAFGKNQQAGNGLIDDSQLAELAVACITACLTMNNREFLFDEIFAWYDDHDHGHVLIDALEPYIVDRQITSLPPAAVKTLIKHFVTTHTASNLEEIICLLDTSTMDIDQVTTLCKSHKLYDAYIYVWNKALHDYVGPLEDLVRIMVRGHDVNGTAMQRHNDETHAQKAFPYMSFILTGRVYPTGELMDNLLATLAKTQIYDFLFSGIAGAVDIGNAQRGPSQSRARCYDQLKAVLHFDTPNFIGALNEAFEDSFLNMSEENGLYGSTPTATAARGRSYNRQYIVRVMLDVMSVGFGPEDTIYLDMFIARNLPKYPQYMLLSGSTLADIFDRLCHYPDPEMKEDAQLSAEYLLSIYRPANMLNLVGVLQEAQFYRVLKFVFKQERKFASMIEVFFYDQGDQDHIFMALLDCLRQGSDLNEKQRAEVLEVLQRHALNFVSIDVRRAAVTVDKVAPDLHHVFVEAEQDDPYVQFEYFRPLFEHEDGSQQHQGRSPAMLEQYVRLMCQFEPSHVANFVDRLKEGDLKIDSVMPAMESSGIIDATVILLTNEGKSRDAMDRLMRHFTSLQAALKGLLLNAHDSPDIVTTNEAIEDLLESVDKYAGVGVWLCQEQTRAAQKSKTALKPPRRSGTVRQPLSPDETYWLDLIISVVSIARDVSESTVPADEFALVSEDDKVDSSLRTVIQRVFTALLNTTSSNRTAATDFMFLRILRAFLTQAAASAPSLSELRHVLSSIFSAYAYEESLLSMSNAMLDKDLFVDVDEVARRRQQGWRPRGQVCEGCRRRAWGPGTGDRVWEAWDKKEQARAMRRQHVHQGDDASNEVDVSRGKGKAAVDELQHVTNNEDEGDMKDVGSGGLGPIVVFSCRHMYHQSCLRADRDLADGHGQRSALPEHEQIACPACM